MARLFLLLAAAVLIALPLGDLAAHADSAGRTALVYVKAQSSGSGERSVVWIARVDGSHARRLTRGFAPRISPDGRWVAFGRPGGLSVIKTDAGASPRRLAGSATAAAWSPDSRHLAAAVGATLVVVDAQTGARVTIDRAPRRLPFFLGFSFSPSGNEIVWAKPARSMGAVYTGDVFRASAAGGSIRRLTRGGRSVRPVWGPRLIAFASFERGTIGKPFERPFQLWAIHPNGSSLGRISRKRHLVPVSWSQAGDRLLACDEREFDCPPAAVDPRTGAVRPLRRLLSGEIMETVALSRDGRHVLLVEGPLDGPHRVTQRPYTGGRATVIVTDADSPDWSR